MDFNTVSKYLVEVRYKPTGKIIDKRGEIADVLTTELLNQWNISTNKIDFRSEDNKNIQAFLSYRNFGFAAKSPHDHDYFLAKAADFIRQAWPIIPSEIIRVGVRSSFYIPTRSFSKLFSAYKAKFLKLSDDELGELGGELVDIGFPLNFEDGDDKYNVVTGPMDAEQAQGYFGDDGFSPNGIYVDVDYFRADFRSQVRQKDVLSLLSSGVQKATEVKNLIIGWIRSSDGCS